MATRASQSISAQVILKSASGRSFDGHTAITAENIGEYLPDPRVAEAAREAFSRAGFEVGLTGGNSFSIAAPKDVFERFFGVNLGTDSQGGPTIRVGRGREMTIGPGVLPGEIAGQIVTVTFGEPPDFGPGADHSRGSTPRKRR